MHKIFLIDAMALIYRGYFALYKYPRITSQGLDVSGIFGFTNTLVEILNKQKPTHVIAAFDVPGPTWRHERYPAYKETRQAQPEAITLAIPYIKELLKGFGIPSVELEGYEADDLLGSLTRYTSAQKWPSYLVSGDKDLAQLLDKYTYLYKPSAHGKPSSIQNEKETMAAWGLQCPKQVIDFLGLCGDSSDEIPGVPHIGPKTAQKLLTTYNNLENIYQHLDELSPRLRDHLKEHREQAFLSKELATIHCDLEIPIVWEEACYHGPDKKLLAPLLHTLEFKSLSKRLFGETKRLGVQMSLFPSPNTVEEEEGTKEASEARMDTYAPDKVTYRSLTSVKEVKKVVKAWGAYQAICVDTETTGLDPIRAQLLGIALCVQPREAYYVVIGDAEDPQGMLEALSPLLTDPSSLKIGQNLKYDWHVLHSHGITLQGTLFDTMIAHHLLEPDQRHGLTSLAHTYLQYDPIEITSLIGAKGKEQLNMADVPIEQVTPYACEDADITFRLYEHLAPQLKEKEVDRLFYDIEMPLLPVLAAMEQQGIALDVEALKEASDALGKELASLTDEIHDLAESTFNIDSPKQLGVILFEQLHISEKPPKTSKGQYATNETVLSKLANHHPIIAKVLTYRALKKLKSTYIDALPALLHPEDHRLHTSFQQSMVSSGRLSSSKPNVQNIPIRSDKGKMIRKAFIPNPSSYVLIAADYSQIELRLMAHFSEDQYMIEAFKTDKDIHAMTASRLFASPIEEVSSEERRKAKMVNFGIMYGISAFGLAQRLDISRTEASQIIKDYFKQFPAVQDYMEYLKNQAREQGYVSTYMGRKRYLPDIHSRNATTRGFAERNAINMPIQGSAAELIKKAMIDIDAWLKKEQCSARLLLQVHDELVFEVSEAEWEKTAKGIVRLMEEVMPLRVPLRVTIGHGKNWLEAHEG